MTKKKTLSRLAAELIGTAEGTHQIGLLDRSAYDKITPRHLGRAPQVLSIISTQIRAMCVSARMSQAVFARSLNLTAGYISAGAWHQRPTGAALALLNIIKGKGIESIL
jgi:putative transcriptional regulator